MATICWASTSSGRRGTRVCSISPSSMRRVTTAVSSRSPRNLGKKRPDEASPTLCPARPTRCRPAATDLGDSICTTRSTAPMSMPSSSDEVATSAGQPPGLQQILDLEPLLAGQRAVVGAGDVLLAQLVETVRDPLRGAAAVHEHDRRAVRPHQLQQARGRRPARSRRAARPPPRARRRARACPRPARAPRRSSCLPPRRRRRSRPRGPRRPETRRSPPAAAASPTARSAARRGRPGDRAAPATASDGCRAWWRRPSGSRRRSRSRRPPASRGPPRSASGTATRAW